MATKNAAAAETPSVRTAALEMWLEAVNARFAWTVRVPNVGVLECYLANGRAFKVMRYLDGKGFEVFVPASDSINIAETLEAARNFIATGKTA